MIENPHQTPRCSTISSRFICREIALKSCKKKLKRTSVLYKKVLIKSTLKFLQNSTDNHISLGNIKCEVSDNDEEEIRQILDEMMYPIANLSSTTLKLE